MKTKTPNRRSPKRPSETAKQPKKQYRIRNWPEYNAALVQRGSLTIWIDEAALAGWLCSQRSGQRGASYTYSDAAITAALLLKAVYHLPLRATQGMLACLLGVLGLDLATPHYSTLSRRGATLELEMSPGSKGSALHLVVDATGCKVYGEGEWKVRQHGWSQRRTWRKLHLAVDENSREIMAATVSTNAVSDGEILAELLDQVEEPVEQVSADGGYDHRPCYEVLHEREQAQEHALRVAIPPRRGARLWQPKPAPPGPAEPQQAEPQQAEPQQAEPQQAEPQQAEPQQAEPQQAEPQQAEPQQAEPQQAEPQQAEPQQAEPQQGYLARNANVERIRAVGHEQWKQESGYHRRSLAETTMFRYKQLIGEKLRARTLERQAREAFVGCVALNRMLRLGRPQSYAIGTA